MLFSIAGTRGRPAIQITRDQIEFLMKQGQANGNDFGLLLLIPVQEVQVA